MGTKSAHLQLRMTPAQKTALRRAAERAGQGMSAFVLARVLPPARLRVGELLAAVANDATCRYALAELNDMLAELPPAEFRAAVAEPPATALSPYSRNYVAAMIEHAAHQKGVEPPAWLATVPSLDEPRFASSLGGLRLHLLTASPVAFRRRNIFIDSTIGDRV